MQADAYAGFNRLYEAGRKPGPIVEAACWAHARRKFFDLARPDKTPIAIEAVERIDALFAIEREINSAAPQERVRAHCAVLVLASLLIASPGHWLYRTGDLSLASDSGAP
jgi:hypothetical protein